MFLSGQAGRHVLPVYWRMRLLRVQASKLAIQSASEIRQPASRGAGQNGYDLPPPVCVCVWQWEENLEKG